MARIAGVELPNKRIVVALTYIYGIGPSTAKKIIATAGLNENTRTNEISDDDVNKLRKIIEKDFRVEGDLRSSILMNIKRLKDIQCYRGKRHIRNLPLRGQRTRNNSRTRKGPKNNKIGAKKKK